MEVQLYPKMMCQKWYQNDVSKMISKWYQNDVSKIISKWYQNDIKMISKWCHGAAF